MRSAGTAAATRPARASPAARAVAIRRDPYAPILVCVSLWPSRSGTRARPQTVLYATAASQNRIDAFRRRRRRHCPSRSPSSSTRRGSPSPRRLARAGLQPLRRRERPRRGLPHPRGGDLSSIGATEPVKGSQAARHRDRAGRPDALRSVAPAGRARVLSARRAGHPDERREIPPAASTPPAAPSGKTSRSRRPTSTP